MSASSAGLPEQINLPFERHEKALQDRLRQALGREISLVITDNSTSMISSGVKAGVISLRLHRMFLKADDCVIDEIVKFVRQRGCRTPLIRRHIRDNRGLLRSRPPNVVNAKTKGRHHDLTALLSSLNAEYFEGRVSAGITWGTRRKGFSVRLRTMGSYSSRTHLIRINPLLDSRFVPRYFIAFVVYHEMLHADMGEERKNGRRLVHTGAFRARERKFADYERAMTWEKRWTGRDPS